MKRSRRPGELHDSCRHRHQRSGVGSGLGWPPRAVIDAALDARFEMVTSLPLLHELRRVLSYPKLAAVLDDGERVVALLAAISHIARPAATMDLARDPDDNRVLEAALAGGAEAIVTGDDDLLVLKSVAGVAIIRPAQFLAMLSEENDS